MARRHKVMVRHGAHGARWSSCCWPTERIQPWCPCRAPSMSTCRGWHGARCKASRVLQGVVGDGSISSSGGMMNGWMKWNVKRNETKWNETKSNQMKSNQMKFNQMKSNQVKSNETKRNEMNEWMIFWMLIVMVGNMVTNQMLLWNEDIYGWLLSGDSCGSCPRIQFVRMDNQPFVVCVRIYWE